MYTLKQEVKQLFAETKIWMVSTCADKPNAIPVFFTAVNDNDDLIIYDVFMRKTLENLKTNKNVSITVYNGSTMEGYQVKGTAQYSDDTSLVEKGNAITSSHKLTTKGVLIVKPEETFVLTPGPNNGKEL